MTELDPDTLLDTEAAVVILEKDRISKANTGAIELLGDGIINRRFSELVSTTNRESISRGLSTLKDSGRIWEATFTSEAKGVEVHVHGFVGNLKGKKVIVLLLKGINPEPLLTGILNSLEEAILVVSNKNKIVFYNKAFLRMWGIESIPTFNREELMEIARDKVDNYIEFVDRLERVYKNPSDVYRDILHMKDGSVFERMFKPIEVQGMQDLRMWVSRNVTERKKLEDKLTTMATIDNLTGLMNRAKAEESLKREIYVARRYSTPLSVLFIDIDFFKRINDTYGHATGDEVLMEIANTLQNLIRESDRLYRWGGEEFLISCPKTDIDEAKALAQRINSRVGAVCHSNICVTVSIGVAQLFGQESYRELISRADKALYKAKRLGRNRVETNP